MSSAQTTVGNLGMKCALTKATRQIILSIDALSGWRVRVSGWKKKLGRVLPAWPLGQQGTLMRILGTQYNKGSMLWVAIIGLAFLSVSLGLYSIPESAIQYWYLYFSPLILAAFRFGLRGGLDRVRLHHGERPHRLPGGA